MRRENQYDDDADEAGRQIEIQTGPYNTNGITFFSLFFNFFFSFTIFERTYDDF